MDNMHMPAAELDVNAPNRAGVTPLAAACVSGHVDVVHALLSRPDTDVNRLIGLQGVTVLAVATQERYPIIVEMLLAHPAIDCTVRTPKGSSLLLLAVESGHVDIMKLLLRHQDWDLEEVMQTATERARGNPEKIMILEVLGAEVND